MPTRLKFTNGSYSADVTWSFQGVHQVNKQRQVELLPLYTRSATTWKPLMVKANSIAFLATVQYSSGKPWILASMWTPLDTNHLRKHPCRLSTVPMALAQPDDMIPQQGDACCHTAKRNWLRNMTLHCSHDQCQCHSLDFSVVLMVRLISANQWLNIAIWWLLNTHFWLHVCI